MVGERAGARGRRQGQQGLRSASLQLADSLERVDLAFRLDNLADICTETEGAAASEPSALDSAQHCDRFTLASLCTAMRCYVHVLPYKSPAPHPKP